MRVMYRYFGPVYRCPGEIYHTFARGCTFRDAGTHQLIICAGVTAFKALKVASPTRDSWVGISGAAGGVESLAVAYARQMGYRPVAIDGGERRRLACMDAGTEIYLDYQKEDNLRSALLLKTDGELCSAMIVCAGAVTAYEAALDCLDL